MLLLSCTQEKYFFLLRISKTSGSEQKKPCRVRPRAPHHLDDSTLGQVLVTDTATQVSSIFFHDDQGRFTRIENPYGETSTFSYNDNSLLTGGD